MTNPRLEAAKERCRTEMREGTIAAAAGYRALLRVLENPSRATCGCNSELEHEYHPCPAESRMDEWRTIVDGILAALEEK